MYTLRNYLRNGSSTFNLELLEISLFLSLSLWGLCLPFHLQPSLCARFCVRFCLHVVYIHVSYRFFFLFSLHDVFLLSHDHQHICV